MHYYLFSGTVVMQSLHTPLSYLPIYCVWKLFVIYVNVFVTEAL